MLKFLCLKRYLSYNKALKAFLFLRFRLARTLATIKRKIANSKEARIISAILKIGKDKGFTNEIP